MAKRPFGEKMGDWIRHILSCCDKDEDEQPRRPLQISGPTNFRREDITIPGLDPEQQLFIREKAISDARKLYTNLQPLPSTPSRPTLMPIYEALTTPRPSPSPGTPSDRRDSRLVDSLKRHSRKLSNSLTKPLEFGFGSGREDSKFEMKGLRGSR